MSEMKSLAKDCQVFAVTHLAQVAACADMHYHVSKSSDDTNTRTEVHLMDPQEFTQQLALIASGEITKSSLAAAQELIKVTRDVKNPSIMEDYRAHSMVLGKSVKYFYNGQAFEGKALAIEENGALTVQTDSGIHSLHSGEITLRL